MNQGPTIYKVDISGRLTLLPVRDLRICAFHCFWKISDFLDKTGPAVAQEARGLATL